MRLCALTLLIAALTMASFEDICAAPSATCRPRFSKASAQPMKVQAGAWEFTFNAILIGCEENLGSLGSKERVVIQGILKEVVVTKHITTQHVAEQAAFRRELTQKIRAAVRRDVITDVFVYVIYSVEKM